LIKDGMEVHKKHVPDVQKPFHAYLEEKHKEWMVMIEKEYNIQVLTTIPGDYRLIHLLLLNFKIDRKTKKP